MFQPTTATERIEAMDMLRGVAVLGILLININAYALPVEAAHELSSAGYEGPIDAVTFALVSGLAGGKFMSLFALLFGAGVGMMVWRRQQRGEPAAGLHFRRLGVLAVIGFIHGVFIWHGDILLPYAICGAALYPCLFLRGKKLLWLCLGLWAVVLLFALGFGAILAVMQSNAEPGTSVSRVFQNESELMRGGILNIAKVRFVHWFLYMIAGPMFAWPWVLALMMTGVLALRNGWMTGERPARDYTRLFIITFALGVSFAAVRIAILLTAEDNPLLFLAFTLNIIDAGLLSMAWGALVMLAAKVWASNLLGRSLIAVGRMALTNYLTQSVICTLLFYGYGFGLFGSLSRTELLGVVLAVWLLQLLWSPWWLSRYERGPVESVWRRWTYPQRPENASIN